MSLGFLSKLLPVTGKILFNLFYKPIYGLFISLFMSFKLLGKYK